MFFFRVTCALCCFLFCFLELQELSTAFSTDSFPPPPPKLGSIPLPAKLAGGLVLFAVSVPSQDKEVCRTVLQLAETVLQQDPLVQMELGSSLEAGGVFSSTSKVITTRTATRIKQFICEFQVNGGNSWAQARVYGIQDLSLGASVRLVSLQVSNMDASLNGGWLQVPIPSTDSESSVAPKNGYRPIEEWEAEQQAMSSESPILDQLREEQARWKQSFDKWDSSSSL